MNGLVYAQDTTFTITTNGSVGIGTTTPEKTLHVKAVQNEIARFETTNESGNSFLSLRNSTGGFANLGRFINDTDDYFFIDLDGGGFGELIVTNPTTNPTKPGKVGIGTTEPAANLHVSNGSSGFTPSTGTELAIESSGNTRIQLMSPANGAGQILFGSPTELDRGFITYDHANDAMILGSGGGTKMIIDDNGDVRMTRDVTISGNVGIGKSSPGFPLEMASGAHVTAGGVWTDASSREYKENISNLTEEEAISALAGLNPVKYNYKNQKDEEYIGFIAEDVPDLVATGDRKSLSPMDIVAVLTKVVQQQQKKIAELEDRLNASQ